MSRCSRKHLTSDLRVADEVSLNHGTSHKKMISVFVSYAWWFKLSAGESMSNYFQGLVEFGARELEAWRANARVAHPDLLLDQLNQLHKLRHRIHPQQRQKPVVERDRLLAFAIHRVVEKID